jgi:hypothetical protein
MATDRPQARRIPASSCAGCGAVMTEGYMAATLGDPDDDLTEPDALAMCEYCGHVALFGPDLRLRELTADERRELESDPKFSGLVERTRERLGFGDQKEG